MLEVSGRGVELQLLTGVDILILTLTCCLVPCNLIQLLGAHQASAIVVCLSVCLSVCSSRCVFLVVLFLMRAFCVRLCHVRDSGQLFFVCT